MKSTKDFKLSIFDFLIGWGLGTGGCINAILTFLFVFAIGDREISFYKDFRLWVPLLLCLSVGITLGYEWTLYCNFEKLSISYTVVSSAIIVFFLLYDCLNLYFKKETWVVIDIVCACIMALALIYKTTIVFLDMKEKKK